eukprot:1696618-Rhodomonas_salina.3
MADAPSAMRKKSTRAPGAIERVSLCESTCAKGASKPDGPEVHRRCSGKCHRGFLPVISYKRHRDATASPAERGVHAE